MRPRPHIAPASTSWTATAGAAAAAESRTGFTYRLDRMASAPQRGDPWRMRSPPTQSPGITYDDIYDPACDLVEATARMRRAAATLQDAQLAPALLNCIEAALHDLAWTAAALEATSVRSTTEHRRGPADPRGPVLVERMQRGWANLQKTLMDAERTAAAARPLVARALAATARKLRARRGDHQRVSIG